MRQIEKKIFRNLNHEMIRESVTSQVGHLKMANTHREYQSIIYIYSYKCKKEAERHVKYVGDICPQTSAWMIAFGHVDIVREPLESLQFS
jgi:hypothetical protein